MAPIIKVDKLCKTFGSLQVLKDLDLEVHKGEIIAIIGASGCGKSVFLRSLDALHSIDSGHIYINGEEINTKRGAELDRIRRKMGMVYQGFHLFEHMDVLDNITLAPRELKGVAKEEAEARAMRLLKSVSLESKKYAMPAELSGGQQQRIAICRCLAMEPEVMLFDEPTSALDPTMAGEVFATIRGLANQGMTMLIVSHEMSFAREVASRVLYFDEMGIYEQGTPEEIFDHPQREKTRAFIHKIKSFDEEVNGYDFDFLGMQSRIEAFCNKYLIDQKRRYTLQLVGDELFGGIMDNCDQSGDAVHIHLNISSSELDDSIICIIDYPGAEWNPFAGLDDTAGVIDEAMLGYRLLIKRAKGISFTNSGGINRISIIV
ncbi:MAG: amino acid ABC transporter ATP-binding protein [Syntrophomonas sp.]